MVKCLQLFGRWSCLGPWVTLMTLVVAALPSLAQTTRAQTSPPDSSATFGPAEPVWQRIPVDTQASLRGLCVYDDQIVWASGTAGTILRSHDAGLTWRVQQVAGAEKLDFRDLQVINPDTIVAMTSGTPARLYRSDNRGESWQVVYESNDPKVFLDAVSFLDPNLGVVMGDPIDGKLFLLRTEDGGKHWSRVEGTPELETGEAGFAASGTNLTTLGQDRVWIALGGGEVGSKNVFSRILMSDRNLLHWQAATTPIPRHPSAGVFSIVMVDSQRGVAVGGDYLNPARAEHHYAITTDGGQTWTLPVAESQPPRAEGTHSAPTGYRSCVAVWKRDNGPPGLLAVGPSGSDLSLDFGQTWTAVSGEGFHAAQFSPSGKTGWGVGAEGRVFRWVGPEKQP